jgi:uncharacterized protein (DUF924 family)
MANPTQEQVLDFWLREIDPGHWWAVDREFDRRLRERFGGLLEQAAAGELYEWRRTACGRLAEIIVLDQFSRNVFRNSARAFAQDAMALVLSQEAVAAGVLPQLSADERAFLLMPFMHSESKAIHARAEILFREFAPAGNLDFELRHKAIIDRFGRYPHRNSILGRESTAEELEFLKQPGSHF